MSHVLTATSESGPDKTPNRVREMFGEIAPRYDLLNRLLSCGIDRYWRAFTARHVKVSSGMEVLDVCTGTGDLAMAIAKRIGVQGKVLGCDFCTEMLDIARRKYPSGDIPFLEADAADLPFEEGRFDCVTVAFGLRNVEDTDQGLRELARVCRPDGQVLILEFSKPTLWGFRHLYQWYFNVILPRIGQAVAKNSKAAYEYLPETVNVFPSGEAMLRRMEQVGLRDVRRWPLTFGIASLYEGRR